MGLISTVRLVRRDEAMTRHASQKYKFQVMAHLAVGWAVTEVTQVTYVR